MIVSRHDARWRRGVAPALLAEDRDVATPIPLNTASLTADSAAAAARGSIVRRGASVEARGITTDSRAVSSGCAFVALRGERFDGHDYLAAASNAGASLLVV